MSNKMMKNQMVKILCLDGDGLGPEIATATRNVLAAVDRRFGLNLELQSAEIGFKSLKVSGSTLPDDVVAAVLQVLVVLQLVGHGILAPRVRVVGGAGALDARVQETALRIADRLWTRAGGVTAQAAAPPARARVGLGSGAALAR